MVATLESHVFLQIVFVVNTKCVYKNLFVIYRDTLFAILIWNWDFLIKHWYFSRLDENKLTMINPVLHGGGRGRKVVALILIVENFGEIQAIVMKLDGSSWNLLQIIFLAKKKN